MRQTDREPDPLIMFKDFKEFANQAANSTAYLMEQTYQQPVKAIFTKKTSVKGHEASFIVFNQFFPAHTTNMHHFDDVTYTHAVYLINYNTYTDELWIQASSENGPNKITLNNRKQIIDQTWPIQKDFVDSLKINNGS